MTQELLPCPFCGSRPHNGLGKVEHCSLHGEPFQRFNVWCPRGCAKINCMTEATAKEQWNTRAGFATIPDPAAFMAAARGMREAAAGLASDVQELFDCRGDCGEWGGECPLQDAHKPDSTIERLQRLLDAIVTIDATLGEQ